MHPAYVDTHLARLSAGASGDTGDLFMHVGYWDDPERAGGRDELALAQRRLNDVLLALADVRDGMSVLDAGCGFGATLKAIDTGRRNMRLFGLCNDPRQIDLARRAMPHLGWIEADACDIPLPGGEFDRILAIECAFHFPSRRRFLAEAARLLRPGGRLALSDFVAGPGSGDPDAHEALLEAFGPWPDPWFEEGGYDDLARASGLRVASREDATARTLPTYRCVLQSPADAMARPVLALQKLLERRVMRMEFLALDKPG